MTTETMPRPGPRPHRKPGAPRDAIRRLRLWVRQMSRVLPLSLRFLIRAALVVALAMLVLGSWIGHYLQSSIAEGIATSSAATIDSLVGHELAGLAEDHSLTAAERAKLDTVFEIGNEADSTRMLQIRIWRLDGSLLYESGGGLVDPMDAEDFHAAAARGAVASSIERIPLEPVGPIEGHSLAVLRIYTPLHHPETAEGIGVAALYYGARSLLDIQFRAQLSIWLVTGLIGLGVIGVLYLIIDWASRTVASQRAQLARNLMESRRLAQEVHALHADSERLRLQANSANESLLHQVGSDIHDGPIQLLTLIILRLSKAAKEPDAPPRQAAERATTLQLATEAMEELRSISSGLVLPELEPLSLAETIELAISRHEDATGTPVARQLGALPEQASMAVKICAYRIIQEALNNAFRHTGAPYNMVSAAATDGRLSVAISNPAKPGSKGGEPGPASDGLGLRGMRFRVESLGGVLSTDIGGSPVSRVSAEIPIIAG